MNLLTLLLLLMAEPEYVRTVQDRDNCLNRTTCEAWQPFARVSDPQSGPVYWLLADTGEACPVTASALSTIQNGETLRCAWRSARLR